MQQGGPGGGWCSRCVLCTCPRGAASAEDGLIADGHCRAGITLQQAVRDAEAFHGHSAFSGHVLRQDARHEVTAPAHEARAH